MSGQNKRYFWLKLQNTYFNQLEQKKMRKQENGKDMQIIYLRMMLLSIDKVSGVKTTSQKGLLIDYDVEGYGETSSFYLPDNCMLDRQINDRRSRSGMPREYVYKTGNSFEWTLYGENIEQQKKIANVFVKKFDDFRNQGRGLYITSSAKGSGKTMLACCIANEILKTHDISVKFISVPDYIELIKAKDDDSRGHIEAIREAGLLIFDDIGTQVENKDWITTALFRLIDRRYTNHYPTIFTSNVSMEELKTDSRISDRIYAVSVPIVMPEVNIRRQIADKHTKDFIKKIMQENGGSKT